MNNTNPHYTILKSLYDLYRENKDNNAILEKVKSISWALEHDLNFYQYGYHELAELMTGELAGHKSEPEPHYIEVIEKSLSKLSNEQ